MSRRRRPGLSTAAQGRGQCWRLATTSNTGAATSPGPSTAAQGRGQHSSRSQCQRLAAAVPALGRCSTGHSQCQRLAVAVPALGRCSTGAWPLQYQRLAVAVPALGRCSTRAWPLQYWRLAAAPLAPATPQRSAGQHWRVASAWRCRRQYHQRPMLAPAQKPGQAAQASSRGEPYKRAVAGRREL